MKRILSSLVILNLFFLDIFCGPFSSIELDSGHAEDTPLYFGNPSDADSSTLQEDNYLMKKPEFTLSYNNFTLGPNWVAWHLSSSDLGEADRSNKFKADKELPESWYSVKQNDYQFSAYGFDRGHICPSADRTLTPEANQQTFLMTNMLPQAPDCNRIVWKALEDYERKLVGTGNELYIFAGGWGRGGTGNRGYFEEIPIGDYDPYLGQPRSSILVPEFFWKIIMILPEGENDLDRITKETQIIAVCIPNSQGCGKNGSWELYECSVDYLEQITGMDFFEAIDDEIEDVIES